jgi:HD-GYP domain-containing protein (c-di-GMP phosphodiesterase class II)
MISILDTWAAMRADRPYRAARNPDEARAELLAVRGTQLDPYIVDVFLELHAADLIGHLTTTTDNQLGPITSPRPA